MGEHKCHTNVNRILPVFQHLCHYESVHVRPVLSVLIMLRNIDKDFLFKFLNCVNNTTSNLNPGILQY